MKKLTDARVVLAENASYNEIRNVKEMIDAVEGATSVRMALVTDKEPATAREIVFGRAARDGSTRLYDSLPHGGYAIVSEGESLFVAYDNYILAFDAIKRVGELCTSGADLPVNIVETPDYSSLYLDKADPEDVRVMTTNIVAAGDLSSLQYLGEKYGVTYIDRIDLQASMILDYLPDFIGLQEIQEGIVNKIEGYMHTELMKRIGHEYTEVDFDELVPVKRHQWTPIAYRHKRWELLERGAATDEEILNVMHRWQWGVYKNRENRQIFIHINLHGPHSGNQQFRDFQPVFFSRVNERARLLTEKYEGAPIVITGDYNQPYDSPSIGELRKDTALDAAHLVAKDTTYPERYGTIDHIMIDTDSLEARAYRMIDNALIYMTSDHRPCFADLSVKGRREKKLRVLFVGNSYTYFNKMPTTAFAEEAKRAGYDVEIDEITRGGYRLCQFADPENENGIRLRETVRGKHYDVAVLQEQSLNPITNEEQFLEGVGGVKSLIDADNFVLYATWGRNEGSPQLAELSMTRGEMTDRLSDAYNKAGEIYGMSVAEVGRAFFAYPDRDALYNKDMTHPSETGSAIAARTIFDKIAEII